MSWNNQFSYEWFIWVCIYFQGILQMLQKPKRRVHYKFWLIILRTNSWVFTIVQAFPKTLNMHCLIYSWQIYEESTIILVSIWCPNNYIARTYFMLNDLMYKNKIKQTKTNKRFDLACSKKIIVQGEDK